MTTRGLSTADATGKSVYAAVAEAAVAAFLIERGVIQPPGPPDDWKERWLRRSVRGAWFLPAAFGRSGYGVFWPDLLPCAVHRVVLLALWSRLDPLITLGDWSDKKSRRRQRKEA
jgi:hypothetical protein